MSPAALGLFERLRAWRAQTAKTHGVPAYVIFHDATLREIADVRPRTLERLRNISGIGAKKLEAYGREILEQVAAFDAGPGAPVHEPLDSAALASAGD